MTMRKRIGDLYRNLFGPMHLMHAKNKLRKQIQLSNNTAESVVDITNSFSSFGWFSEIKSWQINSEFIDMLEWAAKTNPERILEIGTAKGATLLAWCRIASQQVISVDLPGGIHGGGYPQIKQKLFQEFLFDRPDVSLTCIQDDSHCEKTCKKVEAILNGSKLDILFIDGDHTYEGVKKDFELWSPLVKKEGYVVFHDILPHTHLVDCEVDKLWSELKAERPFFEFIENPNQGWAGIGVVKM